MNDTHVLCGDKCMGFCVLRDAVYGSMEVMKKML